MSVIESISAEELELDTAWWRIYEDAFPADEREPSEVILDSVRRGMGMAFRVRRDDTTFGLATTHLLHHPAAVFLVYLAVASDERSRGVGGQLLQVAWEMGAERLSAQSLQPLGLIWEVDPTGSAVPDAEVRQRRIAFFERQGGRVLIRPYLQPPVDGINAVPMSLMFRPADTETLSTESEEALVKAIYFEKYGGVNKIDRSILERLLLRR
ncbi:MAG TPA: GNAT family N-acetyltransferase [Pyrinomonadaceae bacterium]|nr:GNAT family N-acetyltransferase [Pyrinomonadaceae bacterium]